MYNLPQDGKVDSRILEKLLDESLTTSYKLFWFNGIFKEITSGNQYINFRRIVCRMIAVAWYPLLEYHLNFGVCDKLYDIVILIHKKYNIESDINEVELLSFLNSLKDMEIEGMISDFYKYVPYRLISPFFTADLKGLKDNQKNNAIEELSQIRSDVFYKIDSYNKLISISNEWFDYIIKNQNIVYGWMNYKLIYFLQKRNPNVPAIPFKLNAPRQRDLSLAKKMWHKINNTNIITDIYSNKDLVEENFNIYGEFSIDHFIPWSFVLHDELWNLVPTFKRLNSSKSNKLPMLDVYIDKFCELQYNAFNTIRTNPGFKRCIEDYLTINKKMDINNLLHKSIQKDEFTNSLKSTIIPLVQIAYNQGFDIWQNDIC